MYKFQKILLISLLLQPFFANAQPVYLKPPIPVQQNWVDSVYKSLSEEEKIGQLFMVAAYSGGKNYNQAAIEKLIKAHQIGGLIFMQGGAGRQAVLTNKYQNLAQVPLLIAMDAEWGLGMRLDSVANFPRQMMIGATDDSSMAYALGMAVAYQCKRLGVHVNFAPVVDVNNNPANPVINSRSFGEDKKRVTKLAIAYMKGMQDYGVMACAKHFPGHGDTDVDSHKDLPVVKKTLKQLDTLELYPFYKLFAAGVQSVMVAHLSIPALEKELHVPTTLSYNTVTNILKKKMGYNGLIFTDALNMQGVAKYFEPGETDVRAFIAGNDVLLFSQDVPTAIIKIKAAIASGKVSKDELEARVKKILHAKYRAGLNEWSPIDPSNINNEINKYTKDITKDIAAKAVTVLPTFDNITLPKNGKVLYVSLNGAINGNAANLLKSRVKNITFESIAKGASTASIAKQISNNGYDAVVIGIHGLSLNPGKNYGLSPEHVQFLKNISSNEKVIVALPGNAYALSLIPNAQKAIVGYEDNEWTNMAIVNALTGTPANGKLPVTPNVPIARRKAGISNNKN